MQFKDEKLSSILLRFKILDKTKRQISAKKINLFPFLFKLIYAFIITGSQFSCISVVSILLMIE